MRIMNSRRWVVLILLLVTSLVAAAVTIAILPATTPSVIVPSREILEMKYFHDLSGPELDNAPDMSEVLSEYALVTVDPAAFMNDADTNHEVIFGIKGTFYRKEAQYRICLVSVPPPVSPDAILIVRTENGVTTQPLPPVKMYKGRVIGRQTGDAFFTVSDDVLLGRISVNGITYYLEQCGPGRVDGGKTIQILYRSDKVIPRETSRTFESPVPEIFSLRNLDQNRSHSVHIQLFNSTRFLTGEEQFEIATGGLYHSPVLSVSGNETRSFRFTIDGNMTPVMELAVPQAPRFLLDPDGIVTMDDVIFIE